MKISEMWHEIQTEISETGLSLSDLKLMLTGAKVAWGEILLGIDARDRRHVFVPAPDNASEERDDSSRGLRVEVKPYILSGQQRLFCDISCRLEELNNMFSVVAQDMIDELLNEPDASPFAICVRVLEKWRRLLERVPTQILSRQKQAGLLGELLLLSDLTDISPTAISAWTGPEGGRHDFVSSALNIEVKSSTRPNSRRVHIQSIDQLDISEGQKLFLHFVALREPTGQGITIPDLIDDLNAKGLNSVELHEKLAAVGYSPVDREKYKRMPFEVVARLTYRVDVPEFPRLIPASFSTSIPKGVESIGYDIDLDQETLLPLTDEELETTLSTLVDS